MTDTVTLRASSGTYVRSDKPTTIYYSASRTLMYLRGAAAYGFLYTSLPAQLSGRQVLSATLTVTMASFTGGARAVTLQRAAKQKVVVSGTQWNNKPGVLAGSTPKTVSQTGQTYAFDVTSDLQAIALGAAYYGWRLSTAYNAALWAMYGWASKFPPTLVVVLGDVPPAPNDVAPNGTVSVAAPTLTWTAPATLASVDVQVAATSDPTFSAPTFSASGQATTEGMLNLASAGWSGLANGASALVRIRQTTDIGTSPWSAPITITRAALPALTVTGPSSTTTDPTPTISWTFAGQARYQVTVTSNGRTLADSGVVPGDDTAWTPVKGATASGQQLQIRVRAWDAVARTASPGDPGYAEVNLTTTYTPGAATPVASIAAAQDGVRPWVDVSWTRPAGIPDEWLLERSEAGQAFEIVDRFDGVSGGNPVLSYRDYTAPPNTDLTYRIRPVQSGAAGAYGLTATVRMAVTGGWIFDPSSGIYFRHTASEVPQPRGESTVWYEPIGAPASVKRTFALRGIEGTFGGKVKPYEGRSIEVQEAAINAIKGDPSGVFRAAYGRTNVPVVIAFLTYFVDGEEATVDQIIDVVTMEIRQTGELPYPVVTP